MGWTVGAEEVEEIVLGAGILGTGGGGNPYLGKLRTERALEVVEPRVFGYDLPYRPL